MSLEQAKDRRIASSMDRYEELARQATWVASKVSSDVHGVDTMVGHLAEGRFKIGAGDTAVMLEGIITPGKPLPGMVPVVTDNHLLLHDNTLYGCLLYTSDAADE